MNEMKFNKVHQKHVIYVPSAKMLIYGDNDKDRSQCNILNVQDIDRNPRSRDKSINSKYRKMWFKVVGTSSVFDIYVSCFWCIVFN